MVAFGPFVWAIGSLVEPPSAGNNCCCLVSDGNGAPAIDVAGRVGPDADNNELLSMLAARLMASCTIVFNDDIGSVPVQLIADNPVAFAVFANCCCCFAFGVATVESTVDGPFIVVCVGCCFGDVNPGDVRLLTTELVGDKQLAIDDIFAAVPLDADDEDAKLLVMDVNMVECSFAEPADVALCCILLLFDAFWLLFEILPIAAIVGTVVTAAGTMTAADDADVVDVTLLADTDDAC